VTVGRDWWMKQEFAPLKTGPQHPTHFHPILRRSQWPSFSSCQSVSNGLDLIFLAFASPPYYHPENIGFSRVCILQVPLELDSIHCTLVTLSGRFAVRVSALRTLLQHTDACLALRIITLGISHFISKVTSTSYLSAEVCISGATHSLCSTTRPLGQIGR